MAELKPLVCEQCGGTIERSTMKCQYCGTQYERRYEGTPISFVVERPGVHRIRAECRIADDLKCRYPDLATKYTMDKLRQGLADGLLEYMKLTTNYDPMTMCQIIRGEVRVVDPSFSIMEV